VTLHASHSESLLIKSGNVSNAIFAQCCSVNVTQCFSKTIAEAFAVLHS
jgi:hypothetical protein